MSPRGYCPQGRAAKELCVRLNSRSLAVKLRESSRGRGVSINSFCVAAIAAAVENPDPILQSIGQALDSVAEISSDPETIQNAANQLSQSDSSDAFDFLTLTKLEKIARETGLTDVQVHRTIAMFLAAIRS